VNETEFYIIQQFILVYTVYNYRRNQLYYYVYCGLPSRKDYKMHTQLISVYLLFIYFIDSYIIIHSRRSAAR